MHILSHPPIVSITINEMFSQRVLCELSRWEPSAKYRIAGRLRQVITTKHDLPTGRPDTFSAENNICGYPLTVDFDAATDVVFEVGCDVLAKADVYSD